MKTSRLTTMQREQLAELLHRAFLDLRAPGFQYFWEKPEDWEDPKKLQAVVKRSIAFGEAFHNLPKFLVHDGFSFDYCERDIGAVLPEPERSRFLEKLSEIRAMGGKLEGELPVG